MPPKAGRRQPPPNDGEQAQQQPRQRLQRLHSAARAPAASPSTNPDGTPIRKGLKFQPKAATRRSKEERDALAKAEEERKREIAKLQAPTRGGFPSRGRGFPSRGGRGRGDFGRTFDRTEGAASGPFAVVPHAMSSGGPRAGIGAGPTVIIKQEPGLSSSFTSGVVGDISRVGPTSDMAGEDIKMKVEDDNRVDVQMFNDPEYISLLDDDELDEEQIDTGKGKGRAKSHDPRTARQIPVRLQRYTHKERDIGVSLDASSDISAKLKAIQEKRDKEERENPIFFKEMTPLAKDELEKQRRVEEEEIIKRNVRLPLNEENVVKIEKEWKGNWHDPEDIAEEIQGQETPAPMKNEPVRPPKKEKHRRKRPADIFVVQTEEDREEWNRHYYDIRQLCKEFGAVPPPSRRIPSPEPSKKDKRFEREDHDIDDGDTPYDVDNGKLYFVQLPGLLPLLERADGNQASESALEGGNDVQITDDADIAISAPQAKIPVPAPKMRKEKSDEKAEPHKPETFTAVKTLTTAGTPGSIKIHQSGRMTLDWGGVPLEVNRGIESLSHQEVLLTSLTGGKDGKRDAWALAQTFTNVVFVPNLDELLG
ncbi:MAG: hypothetical protein M1834_001066 [Cirrosporium novae-zelandiae]|nr:MAG: hypothetical protein M1834_001066 [Cirrosporium novae-zelandiae]